MKGRSVGSAFRRASRYTGTMSRPEKTVRRHATSSGGASRTATLAKMKLAAQMRIINPSRP